MIKDSRAYLYAKWCVQRGNRKVGKYVKLQARKWLQIADGKHKKPTSVKSRTKRYVSC